MDHRLKAVRWVGKLVAVTLMVMLVAPTVHARSIPVSRDVNLIDEIRATAQDALDQKFADPIEDDDSPGHETDDPDGAIHGSGTVLEGGLRGTELITIGHTDSRLDGDGSTSGDATVLAIAGREIVGAHSDSEGQNDDSVQGTAPVCDATAGNVCVGLLYARSSSRKRADRSSSSSDVSLLYACVLGSTTQPAGPCDGEVGVALGQSQSAVRDDRSSGDRSAEGSSSLASVCVGGVDPVTGACTIAGASAVASESSSRAGSRNRTARESHLASVVLVGDETLNLSDPTVISIPPPCTPIAIVCVFLNQGETYGHRHGSGGRQEALHVSVPLLGALLHGGTSESRATSAADIVLPRPPILRPVPPPPPDVVRPGALPITGGGLGSILMWASALIALGGLLRIRARVS